MSVTASVVARPSSALLVDNPPNPRRTMDALRELGYDSYMALEDIFDNCIDARASMVEVSVSERRGDIIITIQDDGCGMDLETLGEALRLGSDTSREPGDLGKFGMGLVTASIAISQKVEVFTREVGGPALYGAFDLDVIAAENRFVKCVREATSEEAEVCPSPSGTIVRLSKTDRISNRHPTTFANTLSRRIGQIFRKFLRAGQRARVNGASGEQMDLFQAGLRARVNGTPVEPIDPLMLADPRTCVVLESEIQVEGGGSATIRVVDLPDLGPSGNKAAGIIAQNSGFYVVRNNREIIEAHTFDFFKKHPDFAHFRAELCFDGTLDDVFHTDIKKASITPSQSFLDRLRQATQALITQSANQARSRANTGKGQVDHSTAEANITRRASLIPKPRALVEQRIPRGAKGAHPSGNGAGARTAHLTTLKTASGLRVEFEEGDYGESPFYLVKQQGRVITITYNREHPFWRELVEHADSPKVVATLDYLVFGMANAELLVPEQAAVVKANINATLVGLLV